MDGERTEEVEHVSLSKVSRERGTQCHKVEQSVQTGAAGDLEDA